MIEGKKSGNTSSAAQLLYVHLPRQKLILDGILCVADDVHFQKMKQALTKTGKGAPPKVDRGPLTHRLALQLELLRVETKTTWKDMESFFPRTVHGDPLEGLSLRTELEATVKEAAKVKQREGEGAGFTFSFSDFLCVDLGLSIMCRNVGVHRRMR